MIMHVTVGLPDIEPVDHNARASNAGVHGCTFSPNEHAVVEQKRFQRTVWRAGPACGGSCARPAASSKRTCAGTATVASA